MSEEVLVINLTRLTPSPIGTDAPRENAAFPEMDDTRGLLNDAEA